MKQNIRNWGENMELDVKEIDLGRVDWICSAKDRI